ncbi:amidohydrolase/deacetylase family metallohydrolase [Pannonibacter tanglangensis]|nr:MULTISPECIES: amidohydrolase/deacetylase family metallohydrolase [unclassified Pannonibacter]NBN64203.1 amidohydrolase family protein [Pannonibacter sp. XCT-34]
MTARTLTNFRAIGFARNPGAALHIDADGRIVAAPVAGAETIDLAGAYLSPGWADLHVHVWYGGTDISVRADYCGVAHGVTAMADAGSSGEAAFHGLREYVIEKQPETVRAFLNIGSIGVVACNRVPELIDLRFIDVDRTLAVVEANRDVICGIKVRASGVITGAWGIGPAKIAKRVAEICELPLMVHVGEPLPMIDEVFAILSEGDIVTHCFNGKRTGSITDTPALMQMAKDLARSGVRMDVGHGAASYNFAVAQRAIGEGLIPFSISTDLHQNNIDGPVHDLATTVSKLMMAGLTLDQCITGITTNPRSVMGLGEPGVGDRADFTVFTIEDADEPVSDSQGNHSRLSQVFQPKYAVLGSTVYQARRRKT